MAFFSPSSAISASSLSPTSALRPSLSAPRLHSLSFSRSQTSQDFKTFTAWSGFYSDSFSFSLAKKLKKEEFRSSNSRNFIGAVAVTAPTTFKTLTPLGDRVLIKIQIAEEKTQGGILLPTPAQSKPQSGVVVAVGEGKKIGDKQLDPSVSIGDTVVYSLYAGTEVQFNGADHLLLKEDDIVGLLSGDDIKNLKPINERVLIKVAEAEGKTSGGVLLTESAKEKPVVGTVVAVGSGTYCKDGEKKPLSVEAGCTVLYSKFAGNDFKGKDGSEYIVLRASDMLAVLS